jgi:hypothetical protein
MTGLNSRLVVPALIFVQVLFGVNYVVSKIILNQIPTLVWATIRIVFAALFMLVVSFYLRPHTRPRLTLAYIRPVATTAAEALVWQAEHHLANLEMARLTRSISKRELLRLESIANRAMEQCRLFTSVKDAQLMHCSRVVASL